MLASQANDHPFNFIPQNTTDQTTFNYSSRANKTAQNDKSYNTMPPLRFNAPADEEKDSSSGVCSPPLWKPTTTLDEESSTELVNAYRNLSQASRRQAIARGQREMMEMVRNMPESCYELSLKDLVERPRMVADNEDGHCNTSTIGFKVKKTKKKPIMRSKSSVESGGFLLKMVFPVSLGSFKKMKKNDNLVNKDKNNNGDNGDVISNVENIGEKARPNCMDKDWWKKRVSESGRSESCGSSVVSGSIKGSSSGSSTSSSICSSRSNSTRRKKGACWPFIVLKKKTQE